MRDGRDEALTMAAKRKLWKVTTADGTRRPESEIKAYDIYVRNELANWLCRSPEEQERTRRVTVWVDERDGFGWRWHDVVDLAELAKLDAITKGGA